MKRISTLAALALISFGCAENTGFQQFGSSILSSTGLISGSQADSLFLAGDKLSKAASGFTPEQEYYLGRAVSAKILSTRSRLPNQATQLYVNKVGYSLVAFSDRPETYSGYHFLVLNSEEINAVSAPGGFVFVTKGFLKAMPDEDALAAVLAHEIGHVVLGHGTGAISQSNLTSALTILGKEAASSYGGAEVSTLTNVFGDSATEIVDTLFENGYSRSQEYAADNYAAQLLKRTGYNQGSLIAMLKALEAKSGSDKAGWFSTHPKPDDRIDELEDEFDGITELTASKSPSETKRAKRFQMVKGGIG